MKCRKLISTLLATATAITAVLSGNCVAFADDYPAELNSVDSSVNPPDEGGFVSGGELIIEEDMTDTEFIEADVSVNSGAASGELRFSSADMSISDVQENTGDNITPVINVELGSEENGTENTIISVEVASRRKP